MRLGLMLGYWGLGLTAEDQLELVREAEAAGFDSVWTAEAYGSDAATPLAWFAAQTERIKLGAAILQIPGALARDDGDDRRHARPPLGRALAARASAPPGRRWPRAGTGSASASSSRARASTWRSCARRSRASGSTYEGEHVHAAAARRARQGAQADDRAGAGADPDLHRGDRARRTRSSSARSPTAGCRSSSRPSTWTTRARCWRRARRARAARSTASTSPRPCRSRSTTTSTAHAT